MICHGSEVSILDRVHAAKFTRTLVDEVADSCLLKRSLLGARKIQNSEWQLR